jgi:membrane fusion protein, multidrug efflux system
MPTSRSVILEQDVAKRTPVANGDGFRVHKIRWQMTLAGIVLTILAAVGAEAAWRSDSTHAAAPPPSPPRVTVSFPLQDTVTNMTVLLGQFSAVNTVELRAQVGGVLTGITFQDGQIVHKGDPLFTIDQRPFQIRLAQAAAQLQTAQAKEQLSEVELWRARQLKQSEFGSAETVDQRLADQRSSQAGIETAKAAITDAQLDLEFSRITAPFAGRIGAHLVSVGGLVGGSRGGAGTATLLATIVSLDPIYIDFDMSEADYREYRLTHGGDAPRDGVEISLGDDEQFDRHGTLDFIDNAVDRSSGTIHARATVPNPDLAITPGQFARVRVPLGRPAPALLLPSSAVIPDQSREVVMTVAPDGTVVPKPVDIGGLHRGLRVIRSGLAAADTVVIDGLVRVQAGAKVTPAAGTIVARADSDAG